jgi:hypothetical protein
MACFKTSFGHLHRVAKEFPENYQRRAGAVLNSTYAPSPPHCNIQPKFC